MNSLTYISRQFDVLASVSTSGIRSAPPSTSPSRSNIQEEDLPSGPSVSLPEIRNRKRSPTSSRSRTKTQAFIQGPRRKAISNVDPSSIPLPPSPSSSSPSLPEASTSSASCVATGGQDYLVHRSSPSPASRRRRRRRTISYFVLRPFIGVWHFLFSAWFWLIGRPSPVTKRRRSSGVQTLPVGTGPGPRAKQSEASTTGSSSSRVIALRDEAQADDQSDVTLVDSEEDDDRRGLRLRPSTRRRSFPRTSISPSTVDQDPDSFATSASILLETPAIGTLPSILRSDSESVASSPNSAKVRISSPTFANLTAGSSGDGESSRPERRQLTPFPSKERLSKLDFDAQTDEDTGDAAEAEEIEKSLMMRRRKPWKSISQASATTSNPPTQSLAEVDLNIPSTSTPDDKSAVPRTIVTPPSTTSLSSVEPPNRPLSPDTPAVPSTSSVLRTVPSQALLPNRLGNSYLTKTPPSRKPSPARRTTPDAIEGFSLRQPGPGSNPRVTPFHRQKTLVLDLDETLIHSTSSRTPLQPTSSGGGGGPFQDLGGLFIGGGSGGGFGGTGLFSSGLLSGAGGLLGSGKNSDRVRTGHMVEVVLNGRITLYTVYKRPFVDYFLRKVSGWYTLVVFTASMQEYADPVIDWLDGGRGIFAKRLFRESCTQLPNGSYAKDLSQIDSDLSKVCLLDNSPASYSLDQANGIPIEGWYSDPSDEALLDLLPVLDSLRFTSDVRRVLGIKAF